jgi:hypothetical protein
MNLDGMGKVDVISWQGNPDISFFRQTPVLGDAIGLL